jgi:hypothetical protein
VRGSRDSGGQMRLDRLTHARRPPRGDRPVVARATGMTTQQPTECRSPLALCAAAGPWRPSARNLRGRARER